MAIFPKTQFLNTPMKCSSIIGIFPAQYLFEGNGFGQKCYSIYSKICFGYFIWFVLRTYVQFFIIISRDEIAVVELSKNMFVLPLFTITIIRQMLMLTPKFKDLLKQILDNDKYMAAIKDEEVEIIYRKCAKELNRNMKVYLGVMLTTQCSYVLRPMFEPKEEWIVENETISMIPLPLSVWLPFSSRKHFLAVYLVQMVDIVVASSYYNLSQFILIAAMAYPATRLKILKYVLRNLEKYEKKIEKMNNLKNSGIAEFITIRECIYWHKSIIAYIENFNNVMGFGMLLDFIQSSVHLAVVSADILTQEVVIIQLISVVVFLILLNFRLFLYYHYADEVIFLSEGLSASIYQSKWYEKSSRAKFMIFIMIMRAQKPLEFKLGMFGTMSMQKFVSILNAAYSYAMLMSSFKQ